MQLHQYAYVVVPHVRLQWPRQQVILQLIQAWVSHVGRISSGRCMDGVSMGEVHMTLSVTPLLFGTCRQCFALCLSWLNMHEFPPHCK